MIRRLTGRVTAFCNDGETRSFAFSAPNLVVDQSADAQARMADRFSNFSVSMAYFEFGGSGFDEPAPEDTVQSVVAAAVSDRDILRCPIAVPPGYSSSDSSRFGANMLSFMATTSTARPISGSRKGFVSGTDFADGSMVGGACLVGSSGSRDSDLLFARIRFPDPVEKVAGMEIDILWEITFNPAD